MGHYLLGRPWEVSLGKVKKQANFRQVKLNKFLSSIDALNGFGKVLKKSLQPWKNHQKKWKRVDWQ